jgi:hypothetical protein
LAAGGRVGLGGLGGRHGAPRRTERDARRDPANKAVDLYAAGALLLLLPLLLLLVVLGRRLRGRRRIGQGGRARRRARRCTRPRC